MIRYNPQTAVYTLALLATTFSGDNIPLSYQRAPKERIEHLSKLWSAIGEKVSSISPNQIQRELAKWDPWLKERIEETNLTFIEDEYRTADTTASYIPHGIYLRVTRTGERELRLLHHENPEVNEQAEKLYPLIAKRPRVSSHSPQYMTYINDVSPEHWPSMLPISIEVMITGLESRITNIGKTHKETVQAIDHELAHAFLNSGPHSVFGDPRYKGPSFEDLEDLSIQIANNDIERYDAIESIKQNFWDDWLFPQIYPDTVTFLQDFRPGSDELELSRAKCRRYLEMRQGHMRLSVGTGHIDNVDQILQQASNSVGKLYGSSFYHDESGRIANKVELNPFATTIEPDLQSAMADVKEFILSVPTRVRKTKCYSICTEKKEFVFEHMPVTTGTIKGRNPINIKRDKRGNISSAAWDVPTFPGLMINLARSGNIYLSYDDGDRKAAEQEVFPNRFDRLVNEREMVSGELIARTVAGTMSCYRKRDNTTIFRPRPEELEALAVAHLDGQQLFNKAVSKHELAARLIDEGWDPTHVEENLRYATDFVHDGTTYSFPAGPEINFTITQRTER